MTSAIDDSEVDEDEVDGAFEDDVELAERGVDAREIEDLRVLERVAISRGL